MEGVDYAWDRPDLDQLYAAGKRFVCRYLARLPNGKVLTSAELQALHRKGFAVVLNWEQAAGDMLRGYDVGVAHAREALRQADALGAPPSVPIYFSCDVDTNATQRLSVAMYLDGAASVLGRQRVGVYGEADVINVMVPAHAAWGWQTYAWSSGAVSPDAHLLQYRNGVQLAGAVLDLNRTLKPNIGAWTPADTEDDMSLDEPLNQPLFVSDKDYPAPYLQTSVRQALAFARQDAHYARLAAARTATEVAALRSVVDALAAVITAGGGSVDTVAILAGVDARLAVLAQEQRDAVADLGEGGAARVRAGATS